MNPSRLCKRHNTLGAFLVPQFMRIWIDGNHCSSAEKQNELGGNSVLGIEVTHGWEVCDLLGLCIANNTLRRGHGLKHKCGCHLLLDISCKSCGDSLRTY